MYSGFVVANLIEIEAAIISYKRDIQGMLKALRDTDIALLQVYCTPTYVDRRQAQQLHTKFTIYCAKHRFVCVFSSIEPNKNVQGQLLKDLCMRFV